MTKEELLNLKEHARIKYIGTNTDILEKLKGAPKSYASKGLVAIRCTDYSLNYWGKEKGLTIYTWTNGFFENVVPEDWVVVDNKRTDLIRQREKSQVKYADRDVRRELDAFTKTFGNLQIAKKMIDSMLQHIPLADKLRILTTLTEEQKMWFALLDRDPAEVLEVIKKAVASLDGEETNESDRPELHISSETNICPS